MALTPAESEKEFGTILGQDRPKYPHGLTVHLNEISLKKLQIEELPDVGQKKILLARVECISVSEHESIEGGVNRDVTLQITEMGLTPNDGDRLKEAASKLYG